MDNGIAENENGEIRSTFTPEAISTNLVLV